MKFFFTSNGQHICAFFSRKRRRIQKDTSTLSSIRNITVTGLFTRSFLLFFWNLGEIKPVFEIETIKFICKAFSCVFDSC